MTPVNDLVSIVVPTRNVARTIAACLASARAQVGVPTEVIVVDNDSDDGTWELASDLADVCLRGGPERSAQRNAGVRAAAGGHVLWIDADMLLPERAAADALTAARASGATAVYIDEVTVGDGFWTACRTLERRCYVGVEMVEAPRLVARQYLLDHPFDTGLSGTEDAELRTRLRRSGAVMARSRGAPIRHDEGRLRLGDVVRKRYYYGLGIARYRATHPGAAGEQVSATLQAYLRNWRLLLADPIHALGMIVLRAAETLAYLAAMVASRRSARSKA